MIAVLSGRYDIVHPGHIKTILREAQRFDILFVYVWDKDDERVYPAEWAAEMIVMATAASGNVIVKLHPAHFGRCSKDDLSDIHYHDLILSANPQVTKHLRALGEFVEEVKPTENYSCTEVKNKIISSCTEKTSDNTTS